MNFDSMVAVSTGDMFSGEAGSLKLLIELEAILKLFTIKRQR